MTPAHQIVQGHPARIVLATFPDQNAEPLRHGPIHAENKIIGQPSSAGYGYGIGAPIALGHAEGVTHRQRVNVDVAEQRFEARISFGQQFHPKVKRMRS
ncbi:MAG: hypothetical protein MK160_09210 [Rhodobacteraceae bacterium]|nr:hypothetical protein [Paracoccaceae bacterium]